MQQFVNCPSCRGLLPPEAVACPHCDVTLVAPLARKRSRRRLGLLTAVSAGAASLTLMACYGMPPCEYTTADGGTVRGGLTCNGVCVDPASDAGVHCYDVPVTDAGATTDAGTVADAGPKDGG